MDVRETSPGTGEVVHPGDASVEGAVESFRVGCGGASAALVRDGQVNVWDFASDGVVEILRGSAVALSSNGYLAFVPGGSTAVWWSCRRHSAKTIGPLAGALAATPDVEGSVALLPTSGGEEVEVWDVERDARVTAIRHPTGRFRELVVSDDGKYMVSAGEEWIWETSTGRVVSDKKVANLYRQIWEPGGHRLLLVHDEQTDASEIFDPVGQKSTLLPKTFDVVTGDGGEKAVLSKWTVALWLWVPRARYVAAVGDPFKMPPRRRFSWWMRRREPQRRPILATFFRLPVPRVTRRGPWHTTGEFADGLAAEFPRCSLGTLAPGAAEHGRPASLAAVLSF